jgi:hypothetical protein
MKKLAVAIAFIATIGVGGSIPLLAGMVSRSVNVDGCIEQVTCTNGITSVITSNKEPSIFTTTTISSNTDDFKNE